jgi:cell division protein FtsB
MLKTIFQSKWFTPVLLVLLVVIGVGVYKILPTVIAARKEMAMLSQKITDTENSAAQLEQNKELANAESYLEREARAKLNYKKPDEKVVYIYQNQYNGVASSSQPSPTPSTTPKTDIWDRILDWFKKE